RGDEIREHLRALDAEPIRAEQQARDERVIAQRRSELAQAFGPEALLAQVEAAVREQRPAREVEPRVGGGAAFEAAHEGLELGGVGEGRREGAGRAAGGDLVDRIHILTTVYSSGAE